MHSTLNFFRPKAGDEEQSGINMVDLMMWLVIAALLLAAAIQGIGYYQQNANVYQMKSAVDVAKSRVMAVAANDGSIDIDDVDAIVAEENAERANDDITLTVDTIELSAAGDSGGNDQSFELASFATATTVASGETYYIRAAHGGVTKYDVIHLFKDTASKKEGTHLVNKGTTDSATSGGGTPEPTPTTTPSPSPSATATPSPSATSTATATATPTPTPTPEPSPTATRPADSSAAGTLVQASGYSAYWTDKSVQSMASNTGATFGFAISGFTGGTTANHTVVFTGSPEIGVKATQSTVFSTHNGGMWYATIMPEAGGFKEGIGYVTATVTDKTTGAVSKKSWQLTVTAHTGMTQSSYYHAWWTDKTASSMASNATATFGFEIKGAVASDYDVTFTGGENIGAAATQTATFTNYAGSDWYSSITPVAGGFTEGVGTITAKATHKLTGKVFTKTYQLTITPHTGMTQSAYYHAWWTDKTVNSGASNLTATFGFEIKGAVANDYTVTFTGGQNVGAAANQTSTFTNYAGSDWYSSITPVAGGFKVGTDTITATATHKLTGKVFTKTYNLTVVEHPGMTSSSYYGAWFTDKTATVGATAARTFGFEIKGAVANDYTVTMTGGSEVNATTGAVTFTNYAGSDWYANVTPGAGGFTAGTATITATATHKLTGKVYTKTYKLTVS